MEHAEAALASGLPARTAPGTKAEDKSELESLLAQKISLSGADLKRVKVLMQRNSATTDLHAANTGGVYLTMHEPHQLDETDAVVFPVDRREALLAVSVR